MGQLAAVRGVFVRDFLRAFVRGFLARGHSDARIDHIT